MQPGEYPQPLNRPQQVCFPVINGFTTARLSVANPYQPASGTVNGTWPTQPSTYGTIADYNVFAQFENIGAASVTIQLVSTPNITSGPRVNLGNPITVVPSGHVSTNFYPNATYTEFTCTSGGPSQIRMQLASHLDWTLQGFAKYPNTYNTPDLSLYPQYTVSANLPVFGTFAS